MVACALALANYKDTHRNKSNYKDTHRNKSQKQFFWLLFIMGVLL
jgi:hypothetical protein